MATFRPLFKLRVGSAVTPPTLVEGKIPYGLIVEEYAFQTGTLGNDAMRLAHDGELTVEPFPSYLVNFTGEPFSQYRFFPRNCFLDRLRAYDGAGQPPEEEQPQEYIKPWGQPEVLLATFLGTKYFGGEAGWWDYDTNERIEIQWHRTYSPLPSNVFPMEYEYIGAYPSDLVVDYGVPVARLDAQGGINTYASNQLDSINGPLVRGFGSGREYLDNFQILPANSLPRFAPSMGPNWHTASKGWKDVGKPLIMCFNGNNEANINSFIAGYTPQAPAYESAAEIGRNSYHAYGADRDNPETYRWLGALGFTAGQIYGNVVHDPSTVKIARDGRPGFGSSDPIQPLTTGLGYADVMMVLNEAFKDWKTTEGHASIKRCALILAIWWDGLNGTMVDADGNHTIGVKYADPNMKVGVGYAFGPNPGQILELDWELGKIYGRNAQGHSNWFPHIIEGHGYPRDGVTGRGIAFERSSDARQLRACIAILQRIHPSTQYWQTEDGYTQSPFAYGQTTEGPKDHYSYVDAGYGLTAGLRRWAFTLGGMLHKTWIGVRRNVLYDDFNHGELVPNIQWDQAGGYVTYADGTQTESYQGWTSMVPLIAGYTPKGQLLNLGTDEAERWVGTLQKNGAPDIKVLWATAGITTPTDLGTGHAWRFDTTGQLVDTGLTSAALTPSELPLFFVIATV